MTTHIQPLEAIGQDCHSGASNLKDLIDKLWATIGEHAADLDPSLRQQCQLASVSHMAAYCVCQLVCRMILEKNLSAQQAWIAAVTDIQVRARQMMDDSFARHAGGAVH